MIRILFVFELIYINIIYIISNNINNIIGFSNLTNNYLKY